jgi:hypothetical protein
MTMVGHQGGMLLGFVSPSNAGVFFGRVGLDAYGLPSSLAIPRLAGATSKADPATPTFAI